jgi:hypothetical protein
MASAILSIVYEGLRGVWSGASACAVIASVNSWRLRVCALGCLIGCGGAAVTEAAVPDAQLEAVDVPAPPPLQPLTAEEQRLRGEIEGEVGALAAFGPRNLAQSWNLAEATDHLARRLEGFGYAVNRQGFAVGEDVLQNLEVVVPGNQAETVVLAAHYDSAPGSPGVNAGATGAAVLLSLAKELHGQRLERGVRLVWLANESGGAGLPGSGLPGSAAYEQKMRQESVQVVATLTLGSLGRYSLEDGSQRYPAELLYGSEGRTHFGNFIAVLSNASSHGLLDRVRPALARASLPVEELVLPDGAPLAADGPQARFWSAGLAGLVLTDTAQFRSADHDGPLDTLDKVDFDRLARVAWLVRPLLEQLAGPGQPVAG